MSTVYLATFFLLALEPSSPSQTALSALAREELQEHPSVCHERLHEHQEEFNAAWKEAADERKKLLMDGWARMRAACTSLSNARVDRAKTEWAEGQSLLREGLGLAPSVPKNAPPPAKKVLQRSTNRAVFAFPRDQVWNALMESVSDANIRPQSMDRESGIFYVQTDETWGGTWGSYNQAVALLTTKKVRRMSTWMGLASSGVIYVKELDDRQTEVRMSLQLAGCNGWQAAGSGYSCIWEPLESNGYVENIIFDAIERRLPEPISADQLAPMPTPDENVVRAAQDVLLGAQKVAAAFDLRVPTDHILERLVDAQAALESFAASAEADPLPRFVQAIRSCLSEFRDALDAEADRDAITSRATALLDEARTYLANYRTYVQEPTPKIH